MTVSQCTKKCPSGQCWMSLGIGPHRALTYSPMKSFGMNWNEDCEPDLLAQHQYLTTEMLCWTNGQNSHRNTLKPRGKPSQKRGSCYSSTSQSMYLKRQCHYSAPVGVILYKHDSSSKSLIVWANFIVEPCIKEIEAWKAIIHKDNHAAFFFFRAGARLNAQLSYIPRRQTVHH